jgi:formate hydrogenlyase subunit 6/NADH:ubiquinone oxidoreductase subunit I
MITNKQECKLNRVGSILSKYALKRLLFRKRTTAKVAKIKNSTALTRIACQQHSTRCVAVGGCEEACGAETLLAVKPGNQHNTQLQVSIKLPKSLFLKD